MVHIEHQNTRAVVIISVCKMPSWFKISVLILTVTCCYSFRSFSPASLSRESTLMLAEKNSEQATNKAIFALTEAYGSISSLFNPRRAAYSSTAQKTESIPLRIKEEYENLFWVTGNMDMSLWTDDCTFADPFSSFGGKGSLARFKKNADNLGGLVVNPLSKITSFEVITPVDEIGLQVISKYLKSDKIDLSDVDVVRIGWSFTGKLKLPWNPVLAASGVTSHFLKRSEGKIFLYQETWKSRPLDVVKRVFIPT